MHIHYIYILELIVKLAQHYENTSYRIFLGMKSLKMFCMGKKPQFSQTMRHINSFKKIFLNKNKNKKTSKIQLLNVRIAVGLKSM